MKRYVTECQKDDGLYSYTVDAIDFAHAQAICDARGEGEVVKGELFLVIEVPENVEPLSLAPRVDAMMRSLADEGGEAPDASMFNESQANDE